MSPGAICTHETHFFREPEQFDLLERQLVPEWEAQAEAGRRQRHIRVWSAACSSGEEPYSLAMLLLSRFPPGSGWSLEILATDLSTAVLDKARAGIWKREKGDEIPLILCRNVLIYFSPDSRPAVIGRLLDRLVPGGFLFLGHAESLAKSLPGLRSVGPMAYRWTGSHRPGAAALQPALEVTGH